MSSESSGSSSNPSEVLQAAIEAMSLADGSPFAADFFRVLGQVQQAWLQDRGLRSVPQIPVAAFLSRFCPPLRAGIDLKSVVSNLRRGGAVASSGQWRGFPQDSNNGPTAKETLKWVGGIAREIVAACGLCVADATISFIRNNKLLPDGAQTAHPVGYFALRRKGKVQWSDIALSVEAVELDGEDAQEIQGVINGLLECMLRDPRRRFTFKLTIKADSREMRVWYADRKGYVLSEPLDFAKAPEMLIRLFVALIFAEPEQLGWPSPVDAQSDGPRHDLKVSNADGTTEVYRPILSVARPAPGTQECGRTRISAARKLDEHGNDTGVVVMLRRCVIARDVRENIVWREVNEAGQAKPECLMNLISPEDARTDGSPVEEGRLYVCPAKRPQHVVIKDFGRILSESNDLAFIFAALAKTTLYLNQLHKAGFVHCDIHPGNILAEGSDIGTANVYLMDVGSVQKMDGTQETPIMRRF